MKVYVEKIGFWIYNEKRSADGIALSALSVCGKIQMRQETEQ